MKSKLLHEQAGLKTFALVFETGDEVVASLLGFARREAVHAASFQGIGAFERVTLGYFDWGSKAYREIPVGEQVEVLSLLGDVAEKGGEPKVHAHVVVGLRDGSTRGGHLIEARVRPTLELVLTEAPAHLRKRWDDETGLALIRL
jgi:predicted DNA-binding protein with PD1-like motif